MKNVRVGWLLKSREELKRVWELMLQSPAGYSGCCIGLPNDRVTQITRSACC